jgi:hypothetical protein
VAAGAAASLQLEEGAGATLAALVAGQQATVRLHALDAHGNALTTGGACVTAVLETKAPPSDGKENLSQVWAPLYSNLIRASSPLGVRDNSKPPIGDLVIEIMRGYPTGAPSRHVEISLGWRVQLLASHGH